MLAIERIFTNIIYVNINRKKRRVIARNEAPKQSTNVVRRLLPSTSCWFAMTDLSLRGGVYDDEAIFFKEGLIIIRVTITFISAVTKGYKKVEMNFLPDVFIKCEECEGKRFKKEILEVHYQGKNIAEVLSLSVDEALEFFNREPMLKAKLQLLVDVGLGYLELGQSATTLSGGEAQRIKLAAELMRRATGQTLYILDEPTTGLHFDDINRLLNVLYRLVELGNTVLIVEHNLDVIKNADWIIDLGPEGGDKGGYLVAEGAPEQVAQNSKSWTGKYLKRVLK